MCANRFWLWFCNFCSSCCTVNLDSNAVELATYRRMGRVLGLKGLGNGVLLWAMVTS